MVDDIEVYEPTAIVNVAQIVQKLSLIISNQRPFGALE